MRQSLATNQLTEFDHWQPVLKSSDLGVKPAKVELLGQAIAVFRTSAGDIGAMSDVCPHRRMSLSAGRVLGNCIECCYHGWTFDTQGNGESPGTPKLHAKMESFETRDANGLVWIRRRDSGTSFPDYLGPPEMNYRTMVMEVHDMEAPVECVLDNFTELEHTPTTHGAFGFQLERMAEVNVDIKPRADHIKIHYDGPSKPYPWLSRKFMRLSKHMIFHMNGSVHYSPIHVRGDYHWIDEKTGRRSPVGVRNVHFFTPMNDSKTRVFTISFMRLDNPALYPVLPIVKPFMRHTIVKEVLEDKRVLDGLADKSPSLAGLKLSRFDRVIGLHRDRIAKVYRGQPALQSEAI